MQPPHRLELLKPYVGMIARQLSYNRYEEKHARKRDGGMTLIPDEPADCIPDRDSGEGVGENAALRDELNRFV